MEPVLRIFSYLPNPRVYKALIAARLCSVEVEVVGDKPRNLPNWLWDFEARPIAQGEKDSLERFARTGSRGFGGTLYKTDAFLETQPFGTVPAAFSPDGTVGIFESNSILRAVARAGRADCQLYGHNDYEASRIDAFLDANLVFAREAQVYLLGMDSVTATAHERMAGAYRFYLDGIERTLEQDEGYLVGGALSIADIAFVCDFAQFLRERHYAEVLAAQELAVVSQDAERDYPRAFEHMLGLSREEAFADHMLPYLDWYLSQGAAQSGG